MRLRTCLSGCAMAVVMVTTAFISAAAHAQGAADSYPAKPVQIVLPFAPGGSSEVEGRLFAQKLTESTGRTFVLDYRPGASGVIAMTYLTKAAPDGYTILMGSGGIIGTTPALRQDLPYDPIRDVAAVTLLYKRPTVLLVHPGLPVKNAAEYIAYAKAHPGQLNYGTVGAGGSPHFAGAWLHNLTGTSVTFVHYKGTGALMPDLISGRLQATSTTISSSLPMVKAGKLRLLGVTTSQRSQLLPDVPTLAEQVAPGYDFSGWQAVIAPGGTPAAIVNRLRAEFVKAANSPDLNKRLLDEGVIMSLTTPEEFGRFLAAEITRWKKLVQDTGMKVEE